MVYTNSNSYIVQYGVVKLLYRSTTTYTKYIEYVVGYNDTLIDIARRYYTNFAENYQYIIDANPTIDVLNLIEGSKLIIPVI